MERVIVLVTVSIKSDYTGMDELVVDYGYDEATGQRVILPPEHPSDVGGVYDKNRGEYVLVQDDEEGEEE